MCVTIDLYIQFTLLLFVKPDVAQAYVLKHFRFSTWVYL